jgi:type IV secretion system protein VirB10
MSDPVPFPDPERRDELPAWQPGREDPSISPLPGEPGIPDVAQRRRVSMSKKGLLAVVLLLGSLIAVLAFTIQRFAAGGKASDVSSPLVRDRPAAATAEARRLDMTVPPPASAVAAAPRIPALIPTAEEAAPIGVRRTGSGAPASAGPRPPSPEDAPMLLVSSRPGAGPLSAGRAGGLPSAPRLQGPADANSADPAVDLADPLAATTRNLQDYQQQLQGLLDTLTRTTSMATGAGTGAASMALPNLPPITGATAAALPAAGPSGGLFGGQLQGSATPRVAATLLGNRSLTLPKGTAFTCALKTRVISATSGLVGCQVQRNVFSDDGRVLLVERGSHLDGEYRVTSVRPGTVRIPVLWTRLRTPLGVTVAIESPGTGALGESGIDGHVDNRWRERIGAAMLLSVIDDSVQLIIQNQANEGSGNQAILLPSSTSNSSKLAEKVLDSTINIPPLIYQNQGGIVGIYVARDVDFSSVYELQPVVPVSPVAGTDHQSGADRVAVEVLR